MPVILNINTAMPTASVSIGDNGILLHELCNTEQKDHSSFLQPAIKKIMALANINLKNIDAVAVIEGPGSYTGLRVGIAAAKGLCFALKIPLITIGTLEALAASAKEEFNPAGNTLICAMIDARRMEVFTALYNVDLKEMLEPTALILTESSFEKYFIANKMIFVGSGVPKWEKFYTGDHSAIFRNMDISSQILSVLSVKKYNTNKFADVAYLEPLYIKDFFITA